MPIEFRCHCCQKRLRTADNTAGKQTKCPECDTILNIPNPTVAAPPPQAASPFASGGAAAPPPLPPGAVNPNPYASPARAGALAPVQITRGFTRTQIDVGDILSRTWTIYSNNLGQMILGMLIFVLLSVVIALPAVVIFVGGVMAGGAMANQGNGAAGAVIMLLSFLAFFFLVMAISFWLYGGWVNWLLKIARGEPSEFSDIWQGSRYMTRMLAAGLLAWLAVTLGYMLCIVPGIILALMFWQFLWIIVDRNAGAMESLGLSRELTDGNKLNLFLLILLMMLILTVINLIPFAGLFTIPFMWLMMAVTYLRMSGQSTADMRTAPAPAVGLPPAGKPANA